MQAKTKSTRKPKATKGEQTTAPASGSPEQGEEQVPAQEATTAPAKAPKEPKVLPTPAEALAAAKLDNPARFAHVLSVVEQTKDGSPKRVVVECTDKQTKTAPDGSLVSGCTGTREIAVQDLFQVRCCAWCADRLVRKARRNRAKSRDKALRAQARALRGN